MLDLDQGWTLDPQVAVRDESFGALLYHFGTRKLSFLKDRTIVEILRGLENHPDARAAMRAAGVDDEHSRPYAAALDTLARSSMIRPVAAEVAA